MTRYATTVTFTVYSAGVPDTDNLSAISAWADSHYDGLHDTMPDTKEVIYKIGGTHEVKDADGW